MVSVTMKSEEWNKPTCEMYEVRMAYNIQESKQMRSCVKGYTKATAGKPDLLGAEAGASYEECAEWQEKAKSYIWFVEVRPKSRLL